MERSCYPCEAFAVPVLRPGPTFSATTSRITLSIPLFIDQTNIDSKRGWTERTTPGICTRVTETNKGNLKGLQLKNRMRWCTSVAKYCCGCVLSRVGSTRDQSQPGGRGLGFRRARARVRSPPSSAFLACHQTTPTNAAKPLRSVRLHAARCCG